MGEEDFLTFDELRKAQSKERNKDTLQDLDNAFFERARNYLEMKKGKGSYVENKEYRNAKHILEDIIDRRHKKIVKLAVLSVKSNVKVENLLPSEKGMFDEVRDIIADNRSGLQERLFDEALQEQQITDSTMSSEPGTEDEPADTDGLDDVELDADEDAVELDDEDFAEEPERISLEEDEDEEEHTDTEADDQLDETTSGAGEDDSVDAADEEESAGTANNEKKEDDSNVIFGGNDDGKAAEADTEEDETDDTGNTTIFGGNNEEDDEDTGETGNGEDLLEGDDEEDGDIDEDPVADDDVAEDDTDEDARQRIKLLEEVPEFMGVDLEAYGPFDEGEEVAVPEKNAEVLIDQGKAEQA